MGIWEWLADGFSMNALMVVYIVLTVLAMLGYFTTCILMGHFGAKFIIGLLDYLCMSTPERKVKQRMVKHLKEMGAYYFFPVAGKFGKGGVPDIIVCLGGSFIGIECKAGHNQPTELQKLEMQKIEDAGGFTFVVNEDNVDNVAAVLFVMKQGSVPDLLLEKLNEGNQYIINAQIGLKAKKHLNTVTQMAAAAAQQAAMVQAKIKYRHALKQVPNIPLTPGDEYGIWDEYDIANDQVIHRKIPKKKK